MSQNSCCVPGCLMTKKNGIPLHRFPDPVVNEERFNAWITKIGGEIVTMDILDVYGKRRVCHKHFEDIHKYPRNRLSRLAIPILYLSGGVLHVFPNPDKFPEQFKAWVQVVSGQDECNFDYKKMRICDRHFTEKDRNRYNRLNALAVPSLFVHEHVAVQIPNEPGVSTSSMSEQAFSQPELSDNYQSSSAQPLTETEITAPVPSSTVDVQETQSDIQMRDPLIDESDNMLLCPTSGVLESPQDIQMRGIKRTCIIPDTDNKLYLLRKKVKEEFQLTEDMEENKKYECNECLHHNDVDDRNHTFSRLIEQELQNIKPCIRTRCYIDILEYVQSAKGKHKKDLENS